MYCLVYKKGNSNVVRGVVCDFARIKITELDDYKNKGYVTSLKDLTEEVDLKDDNLTEEVDFLSIFNESPKKLTKAQMVDFGNANFSLGLRLNMKEDTLILKIQEALAKEIE